MASRGSYEGAIGSLRLAPGLRVDHLGDERLVLDAARGVVHTLRGDAAKTLDAVLRSAPVPNSEALLRLARAGIVVGTGVPRRDLLAASGFVSALLVTTALPSAAAAATNLDGDLDGGVATVVGTSTLVTEYAVKVGGVDYQLFRVAHDDFNTSRNSNIAREFFLSEAREVDVLLVGGGGGGNIDTSNTGFRTGGGGPGEVHQVSLGVVAANASLDVTVGGRVPPGTSGRETTVAIDGTTLAQERGGGRGAGNGTAVADGGSGGGGRSSAVVVERAAGDAGSVGTGGGSSERNPGAAGDAEDGGGGGGAGGPVSAAGAGGGAGGAGGAAFDIAAFLGTWNGVGSENPLDHRYVAGGGGGGSDTAPGGAGGAAGGVTVGGLGARRDPYDDGGDLRHGVLATGSGGGGGAADSFSADAGSGADGVAWIRVKVAEPN